MPRDAIRLRYDLRMSADNLVAEILIYGEICSGYYKWTDEDLSAKDFNDLLKKAEEKGAKKISIRINSPGGEVTQAVAMRTMLMGCGIEQKEAHIEGLCASAATVPVSIPGLKVTIAEGSEFMIHNPMSMAWGQAKDIEACAERLRKTEKTMAEIYAKRTGKSEEDMRSMMDKESWFTAKEAVEMGFADELIETEPVVASVNKQMMDAMRGLYMRIPDGVRQENEGNTDVQVANTPDAINENKEEEKTMDITKEMLEKDNPSLMEQLMADGAKAERERIANIDALTPPGYEQMAADAKANGTSAIDYHKAIVKAQKEKGNDFLKNREKEMNASKSIPASEPGSLDGDEKAMNDFVAECKNIVKNMSPMNNEGMMY